MFWTHPRRGNESGRLKSTPVSDLLNAAADALGTPAELVRRSAEARAGANGVSIDDILGAWAGGAPVAAAQPSPTAAVEEADEAPATSGDPAPAAESVTPPMPSVTPEPAAAQLIVAEVEPDKPMEPAELRDRIRTSGRVGVWAGAVLGLFAFVIATSSWSETASVTGEEQFRPILISDATTLLIGAALVSVVFGAVVASLARAAAGWTNPSMQLASSKSSTAWIGGALGLVLGIAGGAVLGSGFGIPIEGSEGLVQLPVLPTLLVMLIGGAVLGGFTTLATQFFAVPVAVQDEDRDEIGAVKRRLGGAIGIPMAGLLILLLLVLPFAVTLIESNHLTSGGAAIIAILASAGVLGFASLAGSKPNMKISFGEFLVALAGIGVIIILVFAVLNNTGGEETHEEDVSQGEATVQLYRA